MLEKGVERDVKIAQLLKCVQCAKTECEQKVCRRKLKVFIVFVR